MSGPPKKAGAVAPAPAPTSKTIAQLFPGDTNCKACRVCAQVVDFDTFALFSSEAVEVLSEGAELWPSCPTWHEVCAMPLSFFTGSDDQQRAEHRFLVALDLWFEEQEAHS